MILFENLLLKRPIEIICYVNANFKVLALYYVVEFYLNNLQKRTSLEKFHNHPNSAMI